VRCSSTETISSANGSLDRPRRAGRADAGHQGLWYARESTRWGWLAVVDVLLTSPLVLVAGSTPVPTRSSPRPGSAGGILAGVVVAASTRFAQQRFNLMWSAMACC
jgi:hypothetical protein